MSGFLIHRMVPIGVVTGLLLAFGLHGPLEAGRAGFAVALGVVGAIYLGTLLNAAQPRRVIVQEGLAGGATIFAAALGLLHSAWWLVAGYAGHGVWDWMHHGDRFGARVAPWYPPFCAAVDLTIAAFLTWSLAP